MNAYCCIEDGSMKYPERQQLLDGERELCYTLSLGILNTKNLLLSGDATYAFLCKKSYFLWGFFCIAQDVLNQATRHCLASEGVKSKLEETALEGK